MAHFAREGWNVLGAAYGHARDDATVAWVVSHLDLLRILGVALAVVLLIALSVSWIGFLIIVVLLAAYELWLRSLGQRAQALAATARPAESDGHGAARRPATLAKRDRTRYPGVGLSSQRARSGRGQRSPHRAHRADGCGRGFAGRA